MLQDVIGSDVPAEYGPTRAGDVKHSEADISRAVELLGYETLVSVEDGIRHTVDWYREFRKS
jgi:nucleoside-diphosphate-sugar epimerase